jgi:hypothetical protein
MLKKYEKIRQERGIGYFRKDSSIISNKETRKSFTRVAKF